MRPGSMASGRGKGPHPWAWQLWPHPGLWKALAEACGSGLRAAPQCLGPDHSPEPYLPLDPERLQRPFLSPGGQWVTSGPHAGMTPGCGRDSMTKKTKGLGRQGEPWD